MTENHLRVSQNRGATDANIRPSQESNRSKSQVAHENLQGLRSQKCSDRDEMPKMQRQKPSLEETRTCKVRMAYYRVLQRVSMLKIVFAHPFFINGMACPATSVPPKISPDIFISSPHATPTTPS